jgi:hypothetical protein
MDEQINKQLEALKVPNVTVYEQLYSHLCDYHFGRMTFLELLEKWKEALNSPTEHK